MVNFGPLAAEVCWWVWGTPANFNDFRVLAALLHGTLVVGVSQTLRRWTEGATYIRQGRRHVGHWSTFYTVSQKSSHLLVVCNFVKSYPIFKIFTPLESVWNSLQNSYNNSHLTFRTLPHYLGKLKVQIFCRCGRKGKQTAFLIASNFVVHPQILIFSVFKIASLSPYWL